MMVSLAANPFYNNNENHQMRWRRKNSAYDINNKKKTKSQGKKVNRRTIKTNTQEHKTRQLENKKNSKQQKERKQEKATAKSIPDSMQKREQIDG